jgi:peptide/nickel transport system permease protein
VLAIGGWVFYTRIVRSQVLSLRERGFVEALRAAGASDARILFGHLLPNVMGSIIVVAALEVGHVIVLEGSLSFLGLGVRPPDVSWGSMLSDGRSYLTLYWWIAMFPGLALTLTVLSCNLIGDWLRDLYDPRMRRR